MKVDDYDSALKLIANSTNNETIKELLKSTNDIDGTIMDYTQTKMSTWLSMKYGRVVQITYYVQRTKFNTTEDIATFKDNSTGSYMIGSIDINANL